jgi:PKD domain
MSDLNNPQEKQDEPKKTPSLLASIIKASAERAGNTIQQATQAQSEQNAEKTVALAKKIPREPISLATIFKMLWTLLAVSIIFFGSFLAYVAFNPAEAIFFVNTFSIDPKDIQNLLLKLINVTFGFMMIIISIVWIVTLFRAFWVPKDLKRKRLLSWLLAWVVGIVLFSVLAFWGYLFKVVSASEYDNPDGRILIYDQAWYAIEEYRDDSQLFNTQNLIGPIDIYFDIRSNANLLARRNLYVVQGFEIDFDGAKCNNGKSIISGSNPSNEQSLICRFEEIKAYNIKWTYTVKNREWEVITVPINIPSIEIRWLISIKQQKNTKNQKIVTIDASSLRKLGTPQWIYEWDDRVITESSITEPINLEPTRICFKIFLQWWCDRMFILKDDDSKAIKWSISIEQDSLDSRLFQFSLSGISINPNQILNIEWLLDDKSVMCAQWEEKCNFTFSTYWRKNIKATITIASGEKFSFRTEVDVIEPLNLVRHIKIFNKDGVFLNAEETYDYSLRSFILKNTIIPPESLTFDARDVVSGNPGYILDNVRWKVDDGVEVRELRWLKVDIEFSQPLRYNIEAEIIFKKWVVWENDLEESVKEFAIVDIERKKLMPRLSISKTSDYVPSLVTVDASQSESEEWEIKKFIFDFWEGKPPAEGDAIQQYQYATPGDKEIILTIVADDGEKSSIKKKLILKDQIKTIDWKPSMSVGNPWVSVDFEAAGTNGQIEDYVWNFGDNSPVERGFQVSHAFTYAGKYTIMLTIIYADGTQKTMKRIYEVVPASD